MRMLFAERDHSSFIVNCGIMKHSLFFYFCLEGIKNFFIFDTEEEGEKFFAVSDGEQQ